MEEETKYLVVQFEVNGQEEISVIPKNWMFEVENKSYSYWPNISSKNQRTLIIKRTEPDNWPSFEIKYIIGRYVRYEDALNAEKQAVASSESEGIIRGPGKRKVRQKKTFTPPPSLEDTISIIGLSSTTSSSCTGSNVLTPPIDSEIIESGSSSQIQDIYNNLPPQNNIEIIDVNVTNEELLEKLREIGSTLNMILLRLNILEVGPALRSNVVVNDDKIRDFIPLLTTEDLLQLEELLNNDEDATQQLVYKFNQIGGKNEQDFIRRALSTIFDNKLATMCSWTGQKNNFRIKDCAMIKVLKSATRKPFPNITDLLFEKTIMDWFRHAKQRLNRDT